MSYTKSVTVWCDFCDEWHDGQGSGAIGDIATVSQARRFGRDYGWVYRNGKDICPECASDD